jgi:hypothetical protein
MTQLRSRNVPNNYLDRAVTATPPPKPNPERTLNADCKATARTPGLHRPINFVTHLRAMQMRMARKSGGKRRGFRKGRSVGNEGNKVRHKARTSTPNKLYGGYAAREERAEIAVHAGRAWGCGGVGYPCGPLVGCQGLRPALTPTGGWLIVLTVTTHPSPRPFVPPPAPPLAALPSRPSPAAGPRAGEGARRPQGGAQGGAGAHGEAAGGGTGPAADVRRTGRCARGSETEPEGGKGSVAN